MLKVSLAVLNLKYNEFVTEGAKTLAKLNLL